MGFHLNPTNPILEELTVDTKRTALGSIAPKELGVPSAGVSCLCKVSQRAPGLRDRARRRAEICEAVKPFWTRFLNSVLAFTGFSLC